MSKDRTSQSGATFRQRLELAVAREIFLGWSTPTGTAAAERSKAEQILRGRVGMMLDSDGQVYADYLVALEAYVDALRKALKPQFRDIVRFFSKHPGAEPPLKTLIDRGANPLWIAEFCFRKPSDPTRKPRGIHERRDKDYLRIHAKRLSHRLLEVADDYSSLRARAKSIGVVIDVAHDQSPVLRMLALSLLKIAAAMVPRGPSDESLRLVSLSEHVRLTTGSPHDALVCAFFSAVEGSATGRSWSEGALLRLRNAQRRRGELQEREIVELIEQRKAPRT